MINNILIVSFYSSMNTSIGSVRPSLMKKYLTENDFNVFILSFKKQKKTIEFNKNIITLRNHHKSCVSYFSYAIYKFFSFFQSNSLLYSSPDYYWIVVAKKIDFSIIEHTKPKYIISTYPDISALIIGSYLSEKYNIPHIVDIRDGISIESLKPSQSFKFPLEDIESEILKKATIILTVSDYLTRYYKNKFNRPTFTIYTGYEERAEICPKIFFEPTIINIVYTGRFSLSDSTRTAEPLIKLLDYVSSSKVIKPRIKFHIAGHISKKEFELLCPYICDGLLKYWGVLAREQVYSFQNSASILLLFTDPIKKSVVTGKIFEYFSAKKPILAILPDNEARNLMKKSGFKTIFSFSEFDKIYKFIDSLASEMPHIKHTKYFKDLSAQKQFYSLSKIIKNLKVNG
jgi:hypothetical protein